MKSAKSIYCSTFLVIIFLDEMQLVNFTNTIVEVLKEDLKIVIVIFDIEVFFNRPVNELCEEDFVATVLLDLVKLRIDVRDRANPLEK